MSDSKPTTNWEEQMKQDEEDSKSFMSTPVKHCIAGSSLALLLYAFYPSSDMPRQASKVLSVVHLGSFSMVFGAQMWNSFFAGFLMVRSIPRHIFGHLQSRVLPSFFNMTIAANTLTLATYVFVHPRGTWCCTGRSKVIALSLALATSFLSAYYTAPMSTKAMWDMYKEEKKLGSGMEIGMVYPNAEENPEFAKLHRRFKIWHGISAMVNLVSVGASWAYLCQIATRNFRV